MKALFFDIDGTLVSFATHSIPSSTVAALSRAAGRGCRIFISTGRPMAIIDNLTPIKHLIDGYITTNGAYTTVADNTVAIHPIAPDSVRQLARRIVSLRYASMIVGLHHTAMVNPNTVSRRICRLLNVPPLPPCPIERLLDQPVIQLTPIVTARQQQQLLDGIDGLQPARWHPDFVDITAAGVDKALGMADITAYLGIDTADTIAFGDGGNDIPILRAAGTGIAMGSAAPQVRAAADYITTDVDHHGIAHALRHLHII